MEPGSLSNGVSLWSWAWLSRLRAFVRAGACLGAYVTSFILLLTSSSLADVALPELKGHVNDAAQLLSKGTQVALEQKLSAYEQATGHQLGFVSIPALEGAPIEDFSIRLAEKWKLGDKKRDDGLLLIVAKAERSMRIEVGYGLEGAVTDALSAQIIRNELIPAFRAGDFDGGIDRAFGLLMRAAEGESIRVGPPPSKPASGLVERFLPLILLAILLFWLSSGAGGGGGGRGGYARRGAMLGWGGAFGAASGGRRGGFGGGGFGGGGFGGGGGGFGGGGASGNW